MKKLWLLFILMACMQTLVHAQAVKQQRLILHSINSAGMLNGSSGPGYALQSILGASVHKTFAGLGIGIDQYNLRSVPIFIDLRQELGGALRNIFLYGDGGYNFSWLTDNQKNKLIGYAPDGSRGGLYYDAGLGYTIKVSTRNAFLFSAGYTYKELKSKVGSVFCPVVAPCTTSNDTYTYHYPRIVIKAGLKF